jgi:hypothetical protein
MTLTRSGEVGRAPLAQAAQAVEKRSLERGGKAHFNAAAIENNEDPRAPQARPKATFIRASACLPSRGEKSKAVSA